MSNMIHVYDADVARDGQWNFESSSLTWRPRKNEYRHLSTFDPFPAYPHERKAVDDAVAHVLRCWAPSWDVDLYIANREEIGRTNGHSAYDEAREPCGKDGCSCGQEARGFILLSGKRIPPLPMMARYLVGHEYGHNVQWMIEAARGFKPYSGDLMDEYATMRGLPLERVRHHGGGGDWHDSINEIFACDFRIVVCDILPQSWPHPGIRHPDDVPTIGRWWAEAREQMEVDA